MESAILATLIGFAATFAPNPAAKIFTAAHAFGDDLGAQPLLLYPHHQPLILRWAGYYS